MLKSNPEPEVSLLSNSETDQGPCHIFPTERCLFEKRLVIYIFSILVLQRILEMLMKLSGFISSVDNSPCLRMFFLIPVFRVAGVLCWFELLFAIKLPPSIYVKIGNKNIQAKKTLLAMYLVS